MTHRKISTIENALEFDNLRLINDFAGCTAEHKSGLMRHCVQAFRSEWRIMIPDLPSRN